MVCGDPGVVEGARSQREIGGANEVGQFGLDAADSARDLGGLGEVTFRQVGAVGARIRRQPMRFVEGLADVENYFRTETEPSPGVDLQIS